MNSSRTGERRGVAASSCTSWKRTTATTIRMSSVSAAPIRNIGRQPKAGRTPMPISDAIAPPTGMPAMVMLTTRLARPGRAWVQASASAEVTAAPTPSPETTRARPSTKAEPARPVSRKPRPNRVIATSRVGWRPTRSLTTPAENAPTSMPA